MTDAPRHRVTEIAIDQIVIDDPLVPVDAAQVDGLTLSIAEVGLISPIAVDADMRLRAGRKRLAAVKRLGWTKVPAVVLDELESPELAEVVTVDENVCRFEVSPAVRAILLWQRKQIYEAIYPETTAKESQRQGRLRALGRQDALPKRDTFIAHAAKLMAQPKSYVGNYIRLCDWVGVEGLRRAAGTSLDTYRQLEGLAEMPAEARDALIARAAAGERVDAKAEVREHGYRRPRTLYWTTKSSKLAPLKKWKPKKRPPSVEAPETGTNPIAAAWAGSDAFTRRAFVRAARAELTAILKGLDVAERVPAPVFSLHA